MKYSYSLAATACVLVLSACGGGGGGNGSAPVQTSSLSTITAANAPKAGASVYTTASLINESTGELTVLLTGASVAPAGIGAVSPVLDLVKHAYDRNGAGLLTGVAVSDSCSGGGTVTIDATARNQNSPSNGDSMTFTAFNCTESGITMNGKLSMTMSGVSGDILNTSYGAVTLDGHFENFSATSGSTTESMNGDMKIALNMAAGTLTITVSGTSLQATEQQSGVTVATRTLTAYLVNTSVTGSTVSSAANFSVSGNANGLGQFAYTVKNLQPFVRTSGSGMPTSGSLIVNGAASSVTVTVVPNGVRVDHSANGDGVVTQTSTLNWSDFLAASI